MTKKKLIKISIFTVAGIAVIIAGLVIVRKILDSKTNENVVYQVEKEVYENVIEISGTIAAAQQQTLQARSSGTVIGVYVKAGDKVKKGDLIMQLDATTEEYNLAKHDYDMATKRISGSTRELTLMETQRLSLVQKVSDRQVVATFDGIIADLKVAVGDSLEAKDKVGTLVNVDYLTAEVEVTETDVQKLEVGQKVNFTFSALSNQTVEGYVVSWPAIGEVTSRGATVVNVSLRIDEYPEEILPNFSFTGKIELSPTQENLVVSKYAVAYEDQQAYVVIARTGEKKEVTVQKYGRDSYKVLSGLKGGEVLKQLTVPKNSGSSRSSGGMPGSGGMPSGGMPSGGGMPGGGGGFSGGAGGPPGM